ncbi:MAG TPA: carboxymuconolactone decarboxylase family protein [Bryobacteraceae bacterium]|nr:carboxymuconolactone decarboxylase family protein [Bryobacteraceae bacterium]
MKGTTMRLTMVGLSILILPALALAQAPASPDLHLRGDRFKPLTYDQLTPEQKTMADHLLSGERGGMNGPFNVTLRSPEVGDQAQKLGALLRFHTTLPNRLNEMAILMTARFWDAQYEWTAHKRAALKAGLSPAIVDAIATGKRPPSMQADEEALYNFAHDLLETRQVSDASFKAAVAKFGERGAVDLTGVMGYYCFVSMMLDIDRYPLPEGEKPELKPLR